MLTVPPVIEAYWREQETVPATPEAIGRLEQAAETVLEPLHRAYLERFGSKSFDILGWNEIPATRGEGDYTGLWFLGKDLNDMLQRVERSTA